MKNFLKNSLYFFVLFTLIQKQANSQACFTPSINAQVSTGPTTVVCAGQCANLTASVIPPPNSTTTYSYASVSYSTMPYFGGNNVFSTSSDDLWSDSISIGFDFCYFGNTYKKLLVGSNGEITFDLSLANGPESWITTAILPNLIEHPGNTICGAYRDYDPFPGGVVRTYTTGVAPCRQFIAYWSGVTLFSCATPVSSFQIVLYETTNQIAVNILNSTQCNTWNNGRGLIGIQNGNATVAYGPPTRNTLTAWTAINESWRFYPTAAPSYSVNWAGPGGFTASGLTATACPVSSGNYTATMSYCSGAATSTVQINVNTPTVTASASSNTVCAPGSVTLTGSGATSYTWQPGNVISPTIAVSPTVNTTYTLFGSNAACTGSTTISITVGIPPLISAFNLSGTICPGGTANAVASGALTYTWNPGNIIGNLVALSPTVSTIYTITGSAGGCPGTTTLLIPVGSSPTITATSSPTSICVGGSATLTASGATSYTWNPGGLTGSSVTVNPVTTTVYTVTGTNTLVCPGTQTVMLTVNTTPTLTAVSNPPSICVGSSATLTSSGATTYTWMPGSLSGATVTVSPVVTTIYTVTGSNGTCSSTKTVQLTVNTPPTVTASASSNTVCAGTSLTLTAGGATTYTWNPGALIGTNVVVTPIINTTYTVTGSNGACTNTATILITVNPSPILTAVANPTSICFGSGATVTLTSSGASTYTWMPGALSGATVTVTPAVTTIYTVSGTSSLSCIGISTVVLTINAQPTITAISNPTSICVGGSATLTSTGATSYTWMPGSLSGGTVTVSPAITTIYTVTGSNGTCSNTNTVSLTVNTPPTVTASASPSVVCDGTPITLTAGGATTYTWNPGALIGSVVTVTPSLSTTYTVIGSNGTCTNSAMVSVTVNPSPTVTAVANPTSICLGSGVSGTLTASGATSYTWMPGSLTGASVTVSPGVTTTYTVTGDNGGGCTNTATVLLTVNTTPTVTAAASSATLCSAATITLTSSGATTYTWMPGAIVGATVTDTPTITTTYTVTGANGSCTGTNTVLVTITPGPTLTAVANPTAICSGGSSTLTGSGATTYTWMPGSLTTSVTVVTPTTTTNYTLTGNNGTCSSTIAVTVSVTPFPTITAVANPTATCTGGTATLTASGATTYTWNPGPLTGATVTVNPGGTTIYTVTGDNGGGCTNTQTVSLTVNTVPTVSATATPTAICAGRNATLTASGALTYTWMPGSIFTPVTVVSPTTTTTYTLSGDNGTGCIGIFTLTLVVNPSPTVIAVASPTAICSGQSATLTASGATSTYSWLPLAVVGNPVVVTPTVSTTYTVRGTNAFGCPDIDIISLFVTPTPTVTAAASAGTICAGNTVTLTSTGAAVSYTWMPGAIVGGTVTDTPLITTTYTVTGDNGSGCTGTNTVTVVVNASPTLTAVSSPTAICSSQTATLTGSGAASYTWMPTSLNSPAIVVNPTVTTTYTLTGSNGLCTNTIAVTLSVTTTPTLITAATPTGICVGSSATLTTSGATSYTWMPGSLTTVSIVVNPTITTIYTVTGTNGNCTTTNTISLTVTPIPTVTAVSNPTSMCAGNSATLTGSGATSYTWMPGALSGTSVVVTPTVNTTYTVTGSNGGCSSTNTVSITVFTAPTVLAATSKTAICLGDTATLSATGAVTYTWNPGALTSNPVVVSPVTTTIYTVTGSNGICSTNATVSIIVNTIPTLTVSSSPPSLCSGSSATLTGSGATTYTWMPGSLSGSTVVVTPTVSTTYTITGANGNCSSTTTLALTVNSGPTVTAVSTPTAVCSGASATLTGSGATSYTWMPGALTGATVVVNPLVPTQYTVTGSNGICSGTGTVNINIIPTPTVNAIANPTTLCSGQTTTLTASGALTYTWLPPAITGATVVVSPTVTTTYSVTGINALGCTNTKTLTVIVNTTPTITASSTPTILCSGSSATLTSSGATTYTWMPGSLTGGTVVVSPTVTTIYTVVGANGSCTDTKTLNLVVNPSPTVTSAASPTILCSGSSSTLTANGALSYTWMPGAFTTQSVVVTPTVITIYTVTGINASGCTKTSTVMVNVNTPTITTVATPTIICIGSSATITASGAVSYTWMPGASTATSIVVNPTVTTTYTVTGLSPFGCSGTKTITLNVVPVPTVTAISSSTAVCAGNSATLTGSGATTYTWMPGSLTGATTVVTPTATTIYTVTGSNGVCATSNTISITVNPNPTVTAISNPTAICSGGSSTLTASGATTYSWMPVALTGASVAVTATATTVYTVIGTDALGCTNSTTATLTVNDPTITAIATPTAVCVVGSVTLTANGASTYTWSPIPATGSIVIISPTSTQIYTVTGTNTLGCTGSTTVSITVFTNPTVTAVASPTTICSGLSTTLSSTGALTYTWIPGSLTGGTVVASPTITTTYSVIGVNGVCPADTQTVIVNVLPSPQNVTANNSGPITCLSPSVNLMGSSTTTNIGYAWSGPLSYTSSTQNPTGVGVAGVYTLSVIDLTNGCTTTATTAVITNTAGPPVSLTSTGTITCLSNTVSISVSSTVAAVTYSWSGPSSFTSTASTFTTSTGGVYTVSAFDPASGCTSTSTVAAMTDTYIAVTATIIPATCTGSVSNNNGTILASNFIATDKYDLVVGPTYTGSATYATATIVSGIITTTLTNPIANQPYTIRFFGANGCFKDTTLILTPVDCAVNNALGLAKAISAVTTNTNGTYGVTYKVVVKNSGFATLNNVVLNENLSLTFPLPTTFTVSSAPVIITAATSLTLDATFNGSSQTALTTTLSGLTAGEVDTIMFSVDVLPNGVFGTFNNSVLGAAVGGTASTVVTDSSNVGINTDPDLDGDPTNNNIPTPLNLTPNEFFGVTKQGELSPALTDGSYDITYTVSIHNLGNDTLRNIVLTDALAGTTIKAPATYSMKSGPTASGLLVANTLYDGNIDPLLVLPTSKIGPNSVYNVVFTINVFPDTVSIISNFATGSAVGSNSVTVRDTSNNGNNPDTNGNGIWNEPVDNIPTVLLIDNSELFVPEVFTPDGDGKNDFFVIKGIAGTENTLTVYNRWGNKVYKAENYDNTWQGMPNVSGTLGNQKLPQGTYYYILEFKGNTMKGKNELKNTHGFVVLQY